MQRCSLHAVKPPGPPSHTPPVRGTKRPLTPPTGVQGDQTMPEVRAREPQAPKRGTRGAKTPPHSTGGSPAVHTGTPQTGPKVGRKRGRQPRAQPVHQPGSRTKTFNWSEWAWSRRIAKQEKEEKAQTDGQMTDGTIEQQEPGNEKPAARLESESSV